VTAAEVVTPWDAWFAWLERERPARLYELPLADNEPADDTKPVEAT
jgi:hypothetical protein